MTYEPFKDPKDPKDPEPRPPGIEYPQLESPANPHGVVNYPTFPPPPPVYPGYPAPFYAYPANPYDPYRPGRPPGTNSMAIGSFVCSVASPLLCGVTSVVGLILGVIAMNETKRTGQDGYGLALAGVIIGGAGVALVTIIVLAAIAGA